MSRIHDDFSYDADTFVIGERGAHADLQRFEADYAELYLTLVGEVGLTPQIRERLDRSAELFGLDKDRLRSIEQAMQAQLEARRAEARAAAEAPEYDAVATIREVPGGEAAPGEAAPRSVPAPPVSRTDAVLLPTTTPPPGGGTLAPLDTTTDPRLSAMQARIAVLEAEKAELEVRCRKLEARNQTLEERILGMTVDVDLTDVAQRAARGGESYGAQVAPPPSRTGGEGEHAALEAKIAADPRDAAALHRLFRLLKREADVDRRWRVAQVLVYLGAADDEERAAYKASTRGALIQPARAVSSDEWRDFVRHPDQEVLVGEILTEVAPAVLLAKVAETRRTAPQPATYAPIDPQSSTLPAVRCFAWSAALLGTTSPPVVEDPAWPGLVEMVFATPIASRVGSLALSRDRSPRELAFAVGRHLTWYRRGHTMSVLAASVGALEDLFLAALSIGNPGLPLAADVKRRIAPVTSAIEPLLDPAATLRLRASFLRFVEQGGKTSLSRWALSSDLTAARAGLLLADELAAAHAMLEIEDPARLEGRMTELIRFCLGEGYGTLRKKLGIAVTV